jgi:hypothetical protein
MRLTYPNKQLNPVEGFYTAAASPSIFGDGAAVYGWCGSGCGRCFLLTSTGEPPCDGCGLGGRQGERILVMVTDLCPIGGNERWCVGDGYVRPASFPISVSQLSCQLADVVQFDANSGTPTSLDMPIISTLWRMGWTLAIIRLWILRRCFALGTWTTCTGIVNAPQSGEPDDGSCSLLRVCIGQCLSSTFTLLDQVSTSRIRSRNA